MSEFGGDRPDVESLPWATGPGALTVTEPNPGKKETGWAWQELLPSAAQNWLQQTLGFVLTWIAAAHVRAFSTLASALNAPTALELGRRFAVDTLSIASRDEIYVNNGGLAGAVPVEFICTDGRYVYYYQGGYLIAEDPDYPGVGIWMVAVPYQTAVRGLCCDGGAVYLTCSGASNTYQELRAFDAPTGILLENWLIYGQSLTYSVGGGVASNGEFVAVVSMDSFVSPTTSTCQIFEARNQVAGSGSYFHGGGLRSVAVDEAAAYVVGLAGTGGAHVRSLALTIGTVTQNWAKVLPTTSGTVHLRSVCTDGEYLYICGDGVVNTVPVNIWCLSCYTGALVWEADSSGSGGINAMSVRCDDRNLYVADENGIKVIDKRNGVVLDDLFSVPPCEVDTLDCDGLHVWSAGTNNVTGAHVGGLPTREYVRVSDIDPNRRPFHKLAVPQGGAR
ncbi:MAG: hypothetical protein COW42_13915 [Deltaproteobacteria bacterium CG17_big_fil_post_rev_8_21_14_2_50_63_7]|nr:MAG: hypothetical protein COW42_13915 [Deltaproteobacteria bacterium CG17_big_fil_post_rev_8_21_14_2_50_63_7]